MSHPRIVESKVHSKNNMWLYHSTLCNTAGYKIYLILNFEYKYESSYASGENNLTAILKPGFALANQLVGFWSPRGVLVA